MRSARFVSIVSVGVLYVVACGKEHIEIDTLGDAAVRSNNYQGQTQNCGTCVGGHE
jgi:hypothetical protein